MQQILISSNLNEPSGGPPCRAAVWRDRTDLQSEQIATPPSLTSRFGSSLEEWLVRVRTLNGASHVKSRFRMKLRQRRRLGGRTSVRKS